MRETFRDNLDSYNEVSKQKLSSESVGNDDSIASLSVALDKAVSVRHSDLESQRQVYELQKRKQEIMQALKESVSQLVNPDYLPKQTSNQYKVTHVAGKYHIQIPNKPLQEISLGDIMTSGEWGFDYFLSPASVPRNVRKRFLIETAKRELSALLNKQVLIDEFRARKPKLGISRPMSICWQTVKLWNAAV